MGIRMNAPRKTVQRTAVETPIKVGDVWIQKVGMPDGSVRVRKIKIIGEPTLSRPVSYRIKQNDAHPHRKGKTGQIRTADLRRKYHPHKVQS